ncbi:unnamed protein product, partial [Allacma fusca]
MALHEAGKDDEALNLATTMYIGSDSLTARLTGFTDTHSALTTMNPPEISSHFSKDAFSKNSEALIELLDKNYKVLIYVGQFDIYMTPDKLEERVYNLKWTKSGDFTSAPRKVWRLNGEVAGYTQSTGNFAFAT